MESPRPTSDRTGRLERCIRDLAALSALPSMCVGRTPESVLGIVLDALPTALACDLVYLDLPGTPTTVRGTLHGRPMSPAELGEVAASATADADGGDAKLALAGSTLFCLEAEVPVGAERGRLVAGRSLPLDADTDRVLVRTAANIVGTLIATAKVLDGARRKDDFLAMLGHELRNPLAPILTAVELMANNASVEREREIIARNTHHLTHIVDDLLDISRVARGHVELARELVSLDAVLQRAVELAEPLVAHHRQQRRVARAGDIVLEGDPVRLAQIFGNLLSNAAKFTPPGGEIAVSINRVADRIAITVRDTGRGIAPNQLTRIFEPFAQADRERDALRGGLGLGLAIVSNLVQRHGGTVRAESEGCGRGSAFTVELPTTTARKPPREVRTRVEPAPVHAMMRVLVVDDNVDLAELLADALQSEGYITSVAHDGRGALASWRSFLPHAAVLDVGLPDIDGYELARTLRAEHGSSATLIAASGYGQPTDHLRAADAGFDCYFVKPMSLRDLVGVLDKPRATRDD